MPLPIEDVEATTPKYLRDKYAIVGVGETEYMRGSNRSTRALASIAVRNAMIDAGLKASEIDGMLSYQFNDSVFAPFVAGDLGIRLNFYMDVFGGGSSTEALVGMAIGIIEAGMCKTVVIFRSMNGFSQVRIGGTGVRSAVPVSGDALHSRAYGWQSAGQLFGLTFMRHMHDFGTTSEQVAHVRVAHSHHASNNPKAFYKKRLTIEDVVTSHGFHPTPHALLYHVNLGFPVVAEGTRLVAPLRRTRFTSHDTARAEVGPLAQTAPLSGFVEQVYEHELAADAAGNSFAALVNPSFAWSGGDAGLGFVLEWDSRTLPAFYQWQNLQEGDYVIGLEPATVLAGSREEWKQRGDLKFLEHGQVVEQEGSKFLNLRNDPIQSWNGLLFTAGTRSVVSSRSQ